jgi:hypothetical protein
MGSVREYFLIQLWPAGDAAARHAQVDHVPGVLAKGPRALIVARHAEAQIRGDSARALLICGIGGAQGGTYFSGWILTNSTPSTCRINVSRLAASHAARVGSAHLGVQVFAAHRAVSLATHAHTAEPNLLGHVNRPDACATADVEDAGGLPVLRDGGHGRLVQLVAPRHGEELVVDVHAVLLGLGGSACCVSRGLGGLSGRLTSSHGYM